MYLIAIMLVLIPATAGAQQLDQARMAQTLPYAIQQRNAALDALAVCVGDLEAAQKKLKEAEAAKDTPKK